jgi:hypothetical protein
MKKLILLLVLLMSVSVMEAQWKVNDGGMKVIGPRNGRTGTSYSSWSQSARSDTSQAISLYGWVHCFFNLGSKDSSSVTISYMPSFDGVNFGVAVTIDSLSTGNNAGDSKSIELPTGAKGLRAVKFVRTVNVFRLGTSTPTLQEQILLTK